MSKDYRMDFIREVETKLAFRYDPDEIASISSIVMMALDGYELSERCTDLVVHDDINERLIRRYRACLMVDGKSDKTAGQYVRTIRKLSEKINLPLPEVGAYDIRFFLAMEQERGVSNRTLENTRSYISAFFQWMADDEIIPKNPCSKIKPIKYADVIRSPLSDVELDALRCACTSLKERAIIEALISTGVRVEELSAMMVKDINFEKLTVHVIHGKGAKERIVYTTPLAAKHLIAYLQHRKEDGPMLFYNKNHTRLQEGGIRKILNTIAERAGVNNVHPHRFRRTLATVLYKRGMPIQEIMQILGHSNISTTMLYIAMDDGRLQESYKRHTA